MLLNFRRWFQFGSIFHHRKWRQCNNCHNYTFNGGPNYFFWIFASQIFRSLLFFLSFELTCIMNYNISVAFLLIFYFLAVIWVNTNWWMVNSKNYLITYVWNVFLFHLNLLAAWIMLFLLYICQLFLKRAVSFWIISL